MPIEQPPIQRRRPKQARARATWDAIVEAAAQILERGGPEALTTNEIAARAGVSIGTLYQYFPDKAAIVLAAAKRELGAASRPARHNALMRALIALVETIAEFGAGAEGLSARPNSAAPRKARRMSSVDPLYRVLLSFAIPLTLAPIAIKAR